MDFMNMCQRIYDLHRPNRRSLKKYLINDGQKHPVAIICPGGGYHLVCSFVEGRPFAKALNRMGYSCVVVYYRCDEEARFPAPTDDLAWAVQTVLDHAEEWHLDTDNYSVWGSSAGGHLVASFGTASMGYAKYGLPKPGALTLTYPVITMREKTHGGSRDNLLGTHPSEEMLHLTSVNEQVTENYPPTFVWYGEDDSLVPPANSQMMAEALAANGVPYELHHYPATEHGVGLGKGLPCEGWIEKAAAFWEKHRTKK